MARLRGDDAVGGPPPIRRGLGAGGIERARATMTLDQQVATLRTLLGTYPHTAPLKRGEIGSPEVALEFADIKPTHKAFKPMVRELAYDVCELAIVTFLQAKAHGKPLVLLPAVMLGRFQHHCLVHNADRAALRPEQLAGAGWAFEPIRRPRACGCAASCSMTTGSISTACSG